MRIDLLTLFPNICAAPLNESMMKRAQDLGLVTIRTHNLRDWARDKHRVTDDAPYGGGQGMVMKPEPIFAAVEELQSERPPATPAPEKSLASMQPEAPPKVIFMTPAGRRFDQKLASEYSRETHLIILCGHYEGVDQRVIDQLVDDEISIGDYVLTNGALAAAVFVDAVVRLIPGVLGDANSALDESFSAGQLEGPQYTRPVEFRGLRVPEILMSGNHAAVARWRSERALEKTRRVRPDLLGPEK